MKLKTYPIEKVAQVAKKLDEAPALPPRFIPHSDTLTELSKHIKELHFKKNYDEHEIVELLKVNGIKSNLKEVRIILDKKRLKKQNQK